MAFGSDGATGVAAANADRMFPDGETRRGLINFPLREAVAMKPRTMMLLLALASAATS